MFYKRRDYSRIVDGRNPIVALNAERINVPANPRHYWRYRMHLTLEELIKNKKFNEKLVEMIDRASGCAIQCFHFLLSENVKGL